MRFLLRLMINALALWLTTLIVSGVTVEPYAQDTTAWVLGANYTVGVGKILLGYGQKHPDGVIKTKQVSVGYEHSLSPRTYLYLDLSVKKTPMTVTATDDVSRRHYALGVHHNF